MKSTIIPEIKNTLQLTFTEEEAKLLNLLGYTSQANRELYLAQVMAYAKVPSDKTDALANLLGRIYLASKDFDS